MKKHIFLIILYVLIFTKAVYSQIPQIFNYQAVLRNSSGELINNEPATLRISILDESVSGTVVYSEIHSKTTNGYGMVNLLIGTGAYEFGNFESIDWTTSPKFLKVSVYTNTGFTDIGTTQIVAVPYALYAKNVENNDDADADKTNELQILSISNDTIYLSNGGFVKLPTDFDSDSTNEIQDLDLTANVLTITNKENPAQISLAQYVGTNTDNQVLTLTGTDLSISAGNSVDLSVIQDGVIDADANPVNELQNLILTGDTLKISSGNQVVFPYDSSRWAINGNKLYYNTGNIGIGTNDPNSKLEIKSSGLGALFQVINANNDTVFAVYPDGVKVFVDPSAKGSVGGFAVSGRTLTKLGETVEYFRVTPDSTRIYIKDSISEKAGIGGFAVSGRTTAKTGFNEYFSISGADTSQLVIINPSEPRLIWYPKSEAFLVGRVIIEHPDSIGMNSISTGFESKAIGDWSQAFGFKSLARGDYSTAIGKNAVANGLNSFAFGNSAFAYSDDAYAIGSGAIAIGDKSFAFGSVGVDTLGNFTDNPKAIGDYSFALGLGTKSTGLASTSIGANNFSSGNFSSSYGFSSTASGERSIAIGMYAISSGYGSTSIGYKSNASGPFAFAGGLGSTSEGYSSVSIGANCHALGSRSIAMGDGSIADGYGSVAIGKSNEALTGYDYALGIYNTADGGNSYALGKYCTTDNKEGSLVFNLVSGKQSLKPSRAFEMNFKAENGFRFFANADTLESRIFAINPTGNIGIGIKIPHYKLDVDGSINITGSYLIDAKNGNFADYVFSDSYNLESIEEHAAFMWKNKHLPSLRSADELKNTTYSITERNEQMLEELEKAHIYIEQLNSKITQLEFDNKNLLEKLNKQDKDIALIKSFIELKEK